jgi:hypothetical protein
MPIFDSSYLPHLCVISGMAPTSDTLPESGSLQRKRKPLAHFTENKEPLVTKKKEGHIINVYAYGYSVQCFLCQLDKTSKQKEDYQIWQSIYPSLFPTLHP